MIVIQNDENGIATSIASEGKWRLAYNDSNKELIFSGECRGQVAGREITIEIFDTEEELNSRMQELGISIPEETITEFGTTLY